MIISTSSHNVLMTDDISQYVEDSMQDAFGQFSGHVVSIDARLETFHDAQDGKDVKVVVRVYLRSYRSLITETEDDNLYAAIRRAATDSARAAERQIQRPREVTRRQLEKRLPFNRYSAANI